MVTEVKENKVTEPKFIDPEELTEEQLTDPDFRLKQLALEAGTEILACSKCHHCR